MATDSAYSALVVTESDDGVFHRAVTRRPMSALPDGEVLVRVHYSSLNYKDGLSATGNKGVTRTYPHVPGVDAAGIVEESSSPLFSRGDKVLVTGYELGSNHDGGFAEYVRVPAGWVAPLPKGLSLRESMVLGTAGFTAGLAVHRALHNGLSPENGPVAVTGATGGVGSVAVAVLSLLGFDVVAITRKTGEESFLKALGAKDIVSAESIIDRSGKPLLKGTWAGAIDAVGGEILDSLIRGVKFFGPVAACGNVTSGELTTSVYPFILRGVALLGINSAFTPMPLRIDVWNKLAGEWSPGTVLDNLCVESRLEDLSTHIDRILGGKLTGRVLVVIKDEPE